MAPTANPVLKTHGATGPSFRPHPLTPSPLTAAATMADCGGEGVEDMGDGGSGAPPFPQESPPLPLRDSRDRERQPMQGEGDGEGVRDLSACLSNVLGRMKTWARINSPWVIHFNTGSCNGCDIEILATLTPRYDLERFGVKLKGSPRHADVLLATGPVTAQARQRLVRVYEQMAEPKFVVAIGSCALSGGAFRGCYNVAGGIDQVIPVNAYIPGCPPRPEAIIDGVVKLLMSLAPSPAPAEVLEAAR